MTVSFKSMAAASSESSIRGEGGRVVVNRRAAGSDKIASDKGVKGHRKELN
jgi:hypothetical protein